MAEPDGGDHRELVPIASFVPGAPDPAAIQALLDEAGIHFVMEGSRAYQISVAPDDAGRAAAVLRESPYADGITIYSA